MSSMFEKAHGIQRFQNDLFSIGCRTEKMFVEKLLQGEYLSFFVFDALGMTISRIYKEKVCVERSEISRKI